MSSANRKSGPTAVFWYVYFHQGKKETEKEKKSWSYNFNVSIRNDEEQTKVLKIANAWIENDTHHSTALQKMWCFTWELKI